jgi:DNA repair photolyase
METSGRGMGNISRREDECTGITDRRASQTEKKLHAKDFGTVFFSSVTDPYVGMEAKYKLTRRCLEALADFGYEGIINIQTNLIWWRETLMCSND